MNGHRLPTWREMHMDTSPAIEELQFAFYRKTPAWKKWKLVNDLNDTAYTLTISGLRRRYPYATSEELRRYLAEIILGPLLAARVYGSHPSTQKDAWNG